MTESAEVKLARVETALNTLIGEVRLLRESTGTVGDRITRLEESTKKAVPQVWELRERVAKLELETVQLKLDLEQLRQDYEKRLHTAGRRWWDVARMLLGPVLGAVAGWIAATLQRGLGR